MEKIKNIWFSDDRILLLTDEGKVYSRPLKAFPVLKDADDVDRNNYEIGSFGDDVRWPKLDEDIHISSFYETAEPDYDNEIARIFKQFPQLNVSEVARGMGINKSLLAKYIYGMCKPSEKRASQIKEALHQLGHQLQTV